MEITLIANPTSGRAAQEKVQKVQTILNQSGQHRAQLRWTECSRDGVRIARETAKENTDLVVAIGGDGTINEVVNGLVGTSTALGVIPLGTANCFALETGIPLHPEKAAHILLQSTPHRIHLGKIGETHFLLMGSVGYDAEVVHRLTETLGLKKRWGKLAYLIVGVKSLFQYRPEKLRLTLDDKEILDAFSVVVGNGRNYGGAFHITPLAGYEKEELDVCALQKWGLGSLIKFGWGVIIGGKHIGYSNVAYRKCRKVRIESDRPAAIQIDGDAYGHTPVDMEIVPNALTVYLPQPQ